MLHLRRMPKVPGRKKQTRARAKKTEAPAQAPTLTTPAVLARLDMNAPPPSAAAVARARAKVEGYLNALRGHRRKPRGYQGRVICPTCNGAGVTTRARSGI